VGPRAGLDDVEKRKILTLPGLELQPLGRVNCWRASDDGLCWPKHVRCFMYFYIKKLTLDGTIIYFNI
jgi:hypothetical protein